MNCHFLGASIYTDDVTIILLLKVLDFGVGHTLILPLAYIHSP